MIRYPIVSITDLIGKTMESVIADEESITFTATDGRQWKLCHMQDCCEHATLDEHNGLEHLIGSPILISDTSTNDDIPDADHRDNSQTWTFYKFATAKGHADARFTVSSNGYYSEVVDLHRVDRVQQVVSLRPAPVNVLAGRGIRSYDFVHMGQVSGDHWIQISDHPTGLLLWSSDGVFLLHHAKSEPGVVIGTTTLENISGGWTGHFDPRRHAIQDALVGYTSPGAPNNQTTYIFATSAGFARVRFTTPRFNHDPGEAQCYAVNFGTTISSVGE
jgi:hypothetical protein